jgi:hypothetical protein
MLTVWTLHTEELPNTGYGEEKYGIVMSTDVGFVEKKSIFKLITFSRGEATPKNDII